MNTKLQDLIASLEQAPRLGAPEDKPEGSRYVQISETLLLQLIDELRDADEAMKFAEQLLMDVHK